MTPCEACTLAEQNPNCGRYNADCDGCKARAIACGIEAFEASKSGKVTPRLKAVLVKVWGERWEEGLKLVNKWRNKEKQ